MKLIALIGTLLINNNNADAASLSDFFNVSYIQPWQSCELFADNFDVEEDEVSESGQLNLFFGDFGVACDKESFRLDAIEFERSAYSAFNRSLGESTMPDFFGKRQYQLIREFGDASEIRESTHIYKTELGWVFFELQDGKVFKISIDLFDMKETLSKLGKELISLLEKNKPSDVPAHVVDNESSYQDWGCIFKTQRVHTFSRNQFEFDFKRGIGVQGFEIEDNGKTLAISLFSSALAVKNTQMNRQHDIKETIQEKSMTYRIANTSAAKRTFEVIKKLSQTCRIN